VREIPEGKPIVLSSNPTHRLRVLRGAGTKGYGGPPIKAARSKFIWYAIAAVALVTYFAIDEVVEKPDRP